MSHFQQAPLLPSAPQVTPGPTGNLGPTQPPAPQPESAMTPWWKSRLSIGAATLVLGVVIGAAASNGGATSPAMASPTPTVTVSVPAAGGQAPASGPAIAIPEDGTWLVGTDIKPGIYRSSSDGACYWSRLKNTSGDFEAILANGNGGNQVVTVKKTDMAFGSTRCAPWTKVG